jgi:TonB family protein
VSNLCMVRVFTAGFLAVAFMVAVPANGQTKDSPLRLYKAGDPVPKKTKTVIQKYPRAAQTGSMILELTLRPDGRVEAVTVVRPLGGATDAAVAALKQWRYEPIVVNGRPVWAIFDVRIWNPWSSQPPTTLLFSITTRSAGQPDRPRPTRDW